MVFTSWFDDINSGYLGLVDIKVVQVGLICWLVHDVGYLLLFIVGTSY